MDFEQQSYELAEEGLVLPSSDDAYRMWCKLRDMAYHNGECADPAVAQAACYANVPPGTWLADEMTCVEANRPGVSPPPGTAPGVSPPPGTAPGVSPPPGTVPGGKPCACPPPSEGYPIAVVAAVAAGAALLGYAVSR
jgi:hypothetical protein